MQVLRNTMYKMSLCTWILTFSLVFQHALTVCVHWESQRATATASLEPLCSPVWGKQFNAQWGQNGDSQYCRTLIIPLLICSYVTNITMFQDPRRRKEGMNLTGAKERRVQGDPDMLFYYCLGHCYVSVSLPFIEGGGSFMPQHVESTVDSTAVLSGPWIHETGFDDIHRRSHHCCAEARTKGCSKVARQVVCRGREAESNPSTAFHKCLPLCWTDYCHSPVIRSYFRMSSLIMS